MSNAAKQAALLVTAREVGTDPEYLDNLITFESDWNPLAKNPNSSARGLIQFIDSTARDLGYADSLDLVTKNPTALSQMRGPVADYLRKYGPYPTKQSLYMAVFYPAARDWPPDHEFPQYVQDVNPGIKTPRDYITMIDKFAKQKKKIPLLILLAAGAILMVTLNKRTGKHARRSHKRTPNNRK